MIIVDLNGVLIANLMEQIKPGSNIPVGIEMFRHMALNSLRSYKTKFAEYGELIIACDAGNYWRRQKFPYYKAQRKQMIKESPIDWNSIFECIRTIKAELRKYFPYRIIEVPTAEADDIIATLCMKFGNTLNMGEKLLILSKDRDFIQLQRYGNVLQYSPVEKKWIQDGNPEKYLKEHIITGDRGDGVPNILLPDNYFVVPSKRKKMTAQKLEQFMETDFSKYPEDSEFKVRYERNKMLIDLEQVPNHIQEQVLIQYESQKGKSRSQIMTYLAQHKLKDLLQSIQEF